MTKMTSTTLPVAHLYPTVNDAATALKTTELDTLTLIHWPRSVFCGFTCPWSRVNFDYCAKANIPVIWTCVAGSSYYYRDGDALYAVLVTHAHITQRQFLDAVCATLQATLPNLFVEDNDLRLGSTRCGMSAPELQRSDGAWLNVMELLLHTDLDEAKRALAFPDGVWDHKPVSVLSEWIRPLDREIAGDVEAIAADALIRAMEKLIGG